jgi:NAD(P)-dependent dehydrogenase (short-subunit alcohol dehydrogenase family)
MCLDGKIIVVTDGPAGLELAIARELARNGATVIITFMNRSELKKTCHLMKIVIDFNEMFLKRGVQSNLSKIFLSQLEILLFLIG